MPEGTPETPNPTPTPETPTENKPDPKDEWIAKLKTEAATRRKEADAYKRELEETKKKVESIYERLGAQSDEDAEKNLSEYRAAKEKKGNPELDPTQLLQQRNRLDSEVKKLAVEHKTVAEERDAWKQRYEEKEIGLAIKSALTEFGVKPAFHAALMLDVMRNVKLNEKYEAVYVTKDKDGNDAFEVSVKAGLEDYFKANPDWLPASGSPGSGAKESAKITPGGRIDLEKIKKDPKAYEAVRDQLLSS